MNPNKETWLIPLIHSSLESLYSKSIPSDAITLQKTRKEFKGDATLVCFGLSRFSGKKPQETAEEIGEFLMNVDQRISGFNVVNGFLNIELNFDYWLSYLESFQPDASLPSSERSKVMIEYSSPNTNKPLHLGHIRNNLLGYSVAKILAACGHDVVKVNLINDRGIHICKSMIAWQKKGNGETPASSGIKGDHLVGKYYVEFDKMLTAEAAIVKSNIENDNWGDVENQAKPAIEKLLAEIVNTTDEQKKKDLNSNLKQLINNQTPLMKEAREMLMLWEKSDSATIDLWKTMNSWVYEGFNKTYKSLGVDFDKFYYESETYILGKDIVQQGLEKNVLYKKDDNSVWIDLSDEGLDQKLLLRSDGTSVYMTQDIGTAVVRDEELHCKNYVYVVGNEQDYHFKVLQKTLQKMGYPFADGIYHLSYGMVDLPSGRMKSREGTVVDADDLIAEIIDEARKRSLELGKTDEFPQEELNELYRKLGLGALKYYILKVDPRKRMVFNPEESIDLQGNTGPFIQYTYARIQSLIARAGILMEIPIDLSKMPEEEAARNMIRLLEAYSETIQTAAKEYSPAMVSNYMYELAKDYNSYYQFPVLKEENKTLAALRLKIALKTAEVLKECGTLIGMEMPERM
ncbi:MAG: arginine--tRNA ligase [Bacteroidia bacterium]